VFDELYTPLFPRHQVRVTHRLPDKQISITGRLDFIDDDGAVADWKTVDGTYYVEKDGAREEHISQVMFYCWCESISRGRLYYQSMGNLVKIDLNPTPEQLSLNVQLLEELARTFYEALKTGVTPPVKKERDWECSYKKSDETVYCQYYERCYGGGNNGKTKHVLEGWGTESGKTV